MVGARLEKVRQVWRRVKPYFLGFMVVIVVAGAIWALIYVPKMQVPVCPPGKDGLPPKICFDIENEARKTLAYILGGILAIIGITLAHRRIRALEDQVRVSKEQLQVAQEGQITERFTRAIEQLGSDRMEVRLGGIYALERIAWDSDKDYWPIIETLTAYVRERAPWRQPPPDSNEPMLGKEPSSLTPEFEFKTATDIQAVLTVLGRRKYSYGQGEKESLDLSETDLWWANLGRAHLERADLWGARLEGADLTEAHLEGADLRDARLEGADLTEAHLEGADLRDAQLEGCILMEAHLGGAILVDAYLMGVDLTGAKGLTRDQLAVAIIDEKPRLPDYLQEEPPEASGPEGKSEE
jgi:hypothetical protein